MFSALAILEIERLQIGSKLFQEIAILLKENLMKRKTFQN